MANIVKRVQLSTTDISVDLKASGGQPPKVLLTDVGGLTKLTIEVFIDSKNVDDSRSMSADEIATAQTKYIDLTPNNNNDIYDGAYSVNVVKDANQNLILKFAALVDSKPPHGPLN